MRFATTIATFLALPLLFLQGVVSQQVAPNVRYACDPCINRAAYKVRAIVHGTKDDPFWQQIQASMTQAAQDMQGTLQMELYDTYNPTHMAQDIASVAHGDANSRPDGLIVSIPTDDVANAVQQVIDAGIPVFGINSGAAVGQAMGVIDFISSDNQAGGALAAQEMIQRGADNFLFVNYHEGNLAMEERYRGFNDALQNSPNLTTTPQINSLVVDGNADSATIQAELVQAMTATCCSCPAVLLSGKNILQEVIAAYAESGCSVATSPLGTFETSQDVYDAISADQLTFTIGEQQALQGSLAMVLASLYVSTGKSLSASSEATDGEYLTGPLVINKLTSSMTDSQKECEVNAFPVCPNTKAPDGSQAKCDCTDRAKLKIGGVTHGVTTDSFWDPVYAASKQAAFDMGVQLFNDVFAPEEDETVLHTKMANRITTLCKQEQVGGLFVSIPSQTVVPAIETCLALGIPVMSINAGVDTSKNMSLTHHIGMLEYQAGYKAGKELLLAGGIQKALCINHAEGVNVVAERCAGFKQAIDEDTGVAWVGEAYVADDNQDQYIAIVEDMVGDTGTWAGYGILAAGGPQHVPVLALQERHPDSTIGAFDVSLDLYDAVDQGYKEFGMDQEAYLQGYMPVILLTYQASTGQGLLNGVIESGPTFVTSSPSDSQQICEDSLFETCAAEDADQKAASSSSSDTNRGLVIGLSVLAVVFFLAFVFVTYRMKKLTDHVAALERGGTSVPRLSFSQRISSTVMPVADVVNVNKGETA